MSELDYIGSIRTGLAHDITRRACGWAGGGWWWVNLPLTRPAQPLPGWLGWVGRVGGDARVYWERNKHDRFRLEGRLGGVQGGIESGGIGLGWVGLGRDGLASDLDWRAKERPITCLGGGWPQ